MKKITYKRACELFDESYNDCEEMVSVGSLSFEPADVLKEMDPISYRAEVLSFAEDLQCEIVSNLPRTDKIQKIVECMVNQGIEDSEGFVEYLGSLLRMSGSELNEQLKILEAEAI